MNHRTLAVALAPALAAGLWIATPAAAVDLTTCGQIVTGTANLVADLDCSAEADEALKLKGTLLLNGFTLTGNPGFDVVRCEAGACKVVGPGTITGGSDGVRSDKSAKIDGATITANAGDGIRTDGSAKVSNALVTANGGDGVRAKRTAKVDASEVSGNGADGVRCDRTCKVANGSLVGGNAGNGVDSDTSSKVQDSDVTGNGFDGVRGIKVALKDADAVGNGIDAACGVTDDCADLAAERLPKLKGASSCETSRDTENGGSWGVCTND